MSSHPRILSFTEYLAMCTDIKYIKGTVCQYRPPDGMFTWFCSNCSRGFSPVIPFARTDKPYEMICYPCTTKRQIESMRDRSGPFSCYLSCDGNTITTWNGDTLGTVLDWNPCKLTRVSFTHGKEYRSIRAVDAHGKHWHGRTSPGMYVTLYPCK